MTVVPTAYLRERTALRGRMLVCAACLAAGAAVPARAQQAAPPCGGGRQPVYADLGAALRSARVSVERLAISGTVEFTIDASRPDTAMVGAPTPATRASAAAACRIAALWTSRGDSIAVNWLHGPAVLELVPDSATSTTLADRPQPVRHTDRATLVFSDAARALLAAARARAGEDFGTGRTMVMTLVDSAGSPAVSRLLTSSGVRALDEAALSAMMVAVMSAPRRDGAAVAAWYATPIDWRSH